jgi:hypothetical protein
MRNQKVSSSLHTDSSEHFLKKQKNMKRAQPQCFMEATRFNATQQAQCEAYLALGTSLIEPQQTRKRSFFVSITSSPFNQPQTALKTNVGLTAKQMELQNELAQACYDCEIDKVKGLIEQKDADPAIPDQNGRQPMAAAIWGLSFKVMDYLEEKVAYTQQDWLELSVYVQKKHGAVVPQTQEIITHNDWLKHYEEKYAPWFYSYNETAARAIPQIHMNWDETQHIDRVERANNDGVYVSISSNPKRIIYVQNYSYVMRNQVYWLNSMSESMINRLRGKGLVSAENDQLLCPSTMNLKP